VKIVGIYILHIQGLLHGTEMKINTTDTLR